MREFAEDTDVPRVVADSRSAVRMHGRRGFLSSLGGRMFHDYKGSRFKGFFHIPRQLLDCIQSIDRMRRSGTA